MKSILTISLILFLIMNPAGQINNFIKCMKGIDTKHQHKILFRELLIALGVLLFFNIVGEYLFSLLNISDITVRFALGMILFLSAIKVLFPHPDDQGIKKPEGEPFLVPIAIPMIAGPALIATVMLYAYTTPDSLTTFLAIFIAWTFGVLVVLNSQKIKNVMGTSGIIALEKLMGMILILISVQRIMEGISMFYRSLTTTG